MRKLLLLLFIAAIVGGVVYLYVYEQDWVRGLWKQAEREIKQGEREIRGYKPATTPEEARDLFTKAVKDRDYESAAGYCGGDYAQEMKRAAAAAGALQSAIDRLNEAIPANLRSEPTVWFLRQLEPFPTAIEFRGMKADGDDRTRATLYEELGPAPKLSHGTLQVDTAMVHSLVTGWKQNTPVELKRQDGKSWQIFFPVSPALRKAVDRLILRHGDYVKALDDLRKDVREEKINKPVDLEHRLKTALEGLK